MLFVDIRPRGVRMCRPATDPPTPGWGYGYGQGWINTTRTRTLLYPGGTGTRVQQPVTIPTGGAQRAPERDGTPRVPPAREKLAARVTRHTQRPPKNLLTLGTRSYVDRA